MIPPLFYSVFNNIVYNGKQVRMPREALLFAGDISREVNISLMHSSMLEISFIITGSFSDNRFHVEIVLNILDLFQSIRQVWC